MGITLSLAYSIGLHRNPEMSQMGTKMQRLWKRTWWSCFVRDRIIAFGLRSPMLIRTEDCDVPVLVLDEFDNETLPVELLRMLSHCPAIRDSATRSKLALMFIEKVKLSFCIGQVLTTQYSLLGHNFGITTETTMKLAPKRSAAGDPDVFECDHKLDQWYHNLPEDLRY